jgi:hypothetical protein
LTSPSPFRSFRNLPFIRLVDRQIGGYAENPDAIAAATIDIDAQRMSDGVVAFWSQRAGLHPTANDWDAHRRRLACLRRMRINVHALHDLDIGFDFA